MIKTIVAIMAAGLMLGGCGGSTTGQGKPTITPVPEIVKIDGAGASLVEGRIEVSVAVKEKITGADFKIVTSGLSIISFIPNKEVFDIVTANSGSEKGWEAKMKSSKGAGESGAEKIILGKLVCRPSSGKLTIKDLKLSGGEVEGKPKMIYVNDFEFETTVN